MGTTSEGDARASVEVVKSDRDLNMEFRGQCANIYCKGIKYTSYRPEDMATRYPFMRNSVRRSCHSRLKMAVAEFVKTKLPLIKSEDGDALCLWHEIEFEQSFIRAKTASPSSIRIISPSTGTSHGSWLTARRTRHPLA